MGTTQQVVMGTICLVSAFAFGSYINQTPGSTEQSQVSESTDGGIKSLIAPTSIEPDLVIEKRPVKTPWVKPNLSARLPMPSLPEQSQALDRAGTNLDESRFSNSLFAGRNQNGNGLGGDIKIPPPSDLTGRLAGTEVARAAVDLGPVIEDAPDFSGGLNGTSSMPVVSNRHPGSSPNLADQFRSSESDSDAAIVENAPVFGSPNIDRRLPNIDRRPMATVQKDLMSAGNDRPVVETDSRWGVPDRVEEMASINSDVARPESLVAAPRSLQAKPELSGQAKAKFDNDGQSVLNSNWGDRETLSVRGTWTNGEVVSSGNPSQAEFRTSRPPVDSGRAATIRIDDPGAAFGGAIVRKPSQNQTPEPKSVIGETTVRVPRRVARLPFKLNATAKTRLTRLRDNAIQKIELETTRFADHVVENGESLQTIATRYFGKPDFYLDIYMANRDRLRFPGDIREGMVIKVPLYQ